ncbi:RNA helicase [Sulfurifustis variabilis]|uniref:ATP-dependent RNA helicase RhlB n=1 Tax=Sulfurifustis variabilis TaxID=1675686 RepID=A0A1C7AG06_9GAMM|nr:ATP-dependent RNA helicase RhlB [Sulfurifustis variabilis]BAU50378.1 RNA helicase [Sulfurifustis variabilis]
MSEHHLTDQTFSRLNLPEPLMQGVRQAGFEYCTPIQAQTLPLALAGQDVAGQAQTGTGKTAAFLLALFNRLLTMPAAPERTGTQPRAIVLAPTRELAVQIHKDAEALGAQAGLKLCLVFGGTGYEQQRQDLQAGVDVLIGTPGRIIDYFKQHVFDLRAIQVMVLDEADRMFDLGFIKDIRFLLRRMPDPDKRLNMLFSATLSYRVTELAYEHMNNPQFIRIEPDKRTADKVEQVLYHTALEEKIPLLVGLLRHMDPTRSLVFVNTKDMADRLVGWLKANGFLAEVLSGDVPQNMRLRLLQDFMEGRLPIMVATDVAARGLHIPDVSHVFNFDLPQNAEDYVHRIGRTARAGKSGDAVSFACERYVFALPDIEAYIGHKLPVGKITPELLPTLSPPARGERREREERRGPRRDRTERGARERGGRRERPPRDRAPAAAPFAKVEPREPARQPEPDIPPAAERPRRRALARRGFETPAVG